MRPDRRLVLAIGLALAWLPALAAAAVDVVFLLGDDDGRRTPFYAVAAAFYQRTEPQAAMVRNLRSLAEVREYLVRHRRGRAWDGIVVVVHGSPWTGLDAGVFAHGPHARVDAIEDAQRDGSFAPLPDGVVDAGTTLRLESCGLGRRPELLAAVAALFGIDGHGGQVTGSDRFVAFRVDAATAARFELPFVHALRPRDEGAAARAAGIADLRRELQALAGAAAAGAQLDAIPIEVAVELGEPLPPGRNGWRRQVARDPALQRRLRAHGVQADELQWRVVPASAGRPARLEGRAELLLLRAPIPGSSPRLPAPAEPAAEPFARAAAELTGGQ